MADWETYINSFPTAATLSSQNLSDGPHSTLHGNLGAAINAWLIDAQAAMGSYTTFARKLAAITSANVVNPTSATYGAVGDGSTDDTTAIQAGLTALALIGGGVLVLPEGQFNVTGITVPSNVFIVGAGVGSTTIHCTAALGTTVNFEGTYSALSSSTHCKNAGLRGVKITGTSTGVGINLEHASSLHLTDFRVDNVAYGIRAYGAWDSIIDGDWRVQECDYGLFYASHQNDAILSGVVDTNNIRHVGGTIESCYVTDITITGKGTDGTGTGAQKPNHITFDALKVESSFVQNQPRVILESVHAVRFQTPLFAWTNYDTSFSTPVHGVTIDGDSMQVTFASPSCTNSTTNVIDAWFYLNGTDFCTITDPMFLLNAAPSTAHIEFAGTNDRVDYALDGLKLGPSFTPANLTISGTPTSVRQTFVRADGQVEMTDDLILSDGYAAASTNYVDNAAAGLTWKDAVACATTANVTLSGEQTIDGVLTSTSRVLVKNQSTSHQNGIYVSAAGAWSRATDMDAGSEFPGAAVLVSAGTTLGGTAWTCTNTVPPTVGSTAITFAQFSGGATTLAGDVTGASSATTVAKLGGTVISSTGAGGTVTVTGKLAQSGTPSASTDLATVGYVASQPGTLKPVPRGFVDRAEPFAVSFRNPDPAQIDKTPPMASSSDVFDSRWLRASSAVTGITVTAAAPAVFTKTAHGFVNGEKVMVTAITAGAPTYSGTALNLCGTTFYVVVLTDDTFALRTTRTTGTGITVGGTAGTVTIRKFDPPVFSGIVLMPKIEDLFPDGNSVTGAIGALSSAAWNESAAAGSRGNLIDYAVTAVREWNAANPDRQLWLKIRFAFGYHCPQWLKDYCGTIGIFDDTNLGTATGVSVTTNVFTKTAHGLVNGQRVIFTTAPTGITAGTVYFVVNKTTDTFQVSATSGGSAVTGITNATGRAYISAREVPVWWEVGGSNPYLDVYGEIQEALAAEYDNTPEIGCVTYSFGTDGWFPEPCLRAVSGSATYAAENWQAYIDEGFTGPLDQAALIAALDTHNVWARTYTTVSFNPYQWVRAVSEGGATTSAATRLVQTTPAQDWCLDFIDAAVHVLGPRCILENDSARINYTDPTNPGVSSNYTRMYDRMVLHGRAGVPLQFQTAATATLHQENYDNPIAAYGAVSVNTGTGTFTKAGHALADGDSVYVAQVVGVASTTNGSATITLAGHGLSVDDRVQFIDLDGLTATGVTLSITTGYFVKTVLGVNTFEIAATSGGAAISFTGTKSPTIIGGVAASSNAATGLTESSPTVEGTAAIYWVRDADTGAGTFKLAATRGGTAVTLAGSGTCGIAHVANWRDVVEDLIGFGASAIEPPSAFFAAPGATALAIPWTDDGTQTGYLDNIRSYAEQLLYPT